MSTRLSIRKTSAFCARERGLTLVELLIVIAFFTIITGSIVGFFLSTLSGRAKVSAHIEAQQQARLALDRIIYEIRRSNGIQGSSSLGINLATATGTNVGLTMSDLSRNPTLFSVSNGILRIQQGSGALNTLTSSDVTVSNLTFTRLVPANTHSTSLLINLVVRKPDPAGTAVLNISYPLETAVELEGK